MVKITLDNVEFYLKEYHDFQWIHTYGTVFCVFDQTGSGCISMGVDNGIKRYFIKIAGANTVEAEIDSLESIRIMENAVKLYERLRHPNLIQLIEYFTVETMFAAVFEWAYGECLFDHWNFDYYAENPHIKSPMVRYKELPAKKRLDSVHILFSFLIDTAENNYVAVDFYDGSIMYDFNTETTTICDIDFFREKPTINDMGEEFWGSKRLKAPEEYVLNAAIDERTNVFTLGALIFQTFGTFTEQEIKLRYVNKAFLPCAREKWELDDATYFVARKAVSADRNERYGSIREFYEEWNKALQNQR